MAMGAGRGRRIVPGATSSPVLLHGNGRWPWRKNRPRCYFRRAFLRRRFFFRGFAIFLLTNHPASTANDRSNSAVQSISLLSSPVDGESCSFGPCCPSNKFGISNSFGVPPTSDVFTSTGVLVSPDMPGSPGVSGSPGVLGSPGVSDSPGVPGSPGVSGSPTTVFRENLAIYVAFSVAE